MRPNITDAMIAALAAGIVYPVIFVQIGFASETVYCCTSYWPLILAGQVYAGVGEALSFSTIEEGSDIEARGVSITLSGIDPKLIPEALNDYQVGLPVVITLGLATGSGYNSLIGTLTAWSGRTDQPTIDFGPARPSITINCESMLMDMNTPVPLRYTQADQQRFYPGDQGFSWVNSIQNKPIYWNQNISSNGG